MGKCEECGSRNLIKEGHAGKKGKIYIVIVCRTCDYKVIVKKPKKKPL